MTESTATESEILAYVYDELSSAERRAFEEKIAAAPELRAEVDAMLATRRWLGSDARFGEDSGRDLPPPHLVDAIVQAEAIARSASVREALQAQPVASGNKGKGWLGRLNQWVFGGGIAVAATLAFLVFNKTPENEEPPAMDAVMQAANDVGSPAPAAESQKAIEFEKADLAESTTPSSAKAAAPGMAAEELAEADVEKNARFEAAKDGKRAGASLAKTKATGTAPAKAPSASSVQPEGIAADFGVAMSPSANEGAAMRGSIAGVSGSGGAALSAEALEPAAPAAGARMMPPVPKPAARAQAAKKRLRMREISPERQERMQLRENLRTQEAQSEAQMTLASAGIALNEERYAEALELFVRAGHEDRATKSLGAAPWIGQMRALIALRRFEQALDLFSELKRRTRGQSEERALSHWFAGQAAESLQRLAEAKSHYRFAARNHASLQAQAQAAFKRVQNQEKAAKASSAAPSASSASAAEQPTP